MSILKQARDILSNKNRWCQGRFRYKPGYGRVEQFCAIGACQHVIKESLGCDSDYLEESDYLKARNTLDKAANKINPNLGPIGINDRLGYEKVLEMFDLAICMEECASSLPPLEEAN